MASAETAGSPAVGSLKVDDCCVRTSFRKVRAWAKLPRRANASDLISRISSGRKSG
jgi:hypothetical protein